MTADEHDTPPAEVSIHVIIDEFMAHLAGAVVMFADDDLPVYELIAAACPGESQRLDLLQALVIKEYNARLAAQRAERILETPTEPTPDLEEGP